MGEDGRAIAFDMLVEPDAGALPLDLPLSPRRTMAARVMANWPTPHLPRGSVHSVTLPVGRGIKELAMRTGAEFAQGVPLLAPAGDRIKDDFYRG